MWLAGWCLLTLTAFRRAQHQALLLSLVPEDVVHKLQQAQGGSARSVLAVGQTPAEVRTGDAPGEGLLALGT